MKVYYESIYPNAINRHCSPQIETNRKLMQQNLHLSYPNAIDKPNISLQKFASPKFAVFYV